jgi:hypothetical protein
MTALMSRQHREEAAHVLGRSGRLVGEWLPPLPLMPMHGVARGASAADAACGCPLPAGSRLPGLDSCPARRSLAVRPFSRPATAMLATSRLTSHSNGPGRRWIISDPPLIVPIEELAGHLDVDAVYWFLRRAGGLNSRRGRPPPQDRFFGQHPGDVADLGRHPGGGDDELA